MCNLIHYGSCSPKKVKENKKNNNIKKVDCNLGKKFSDKDIKDIQKLRKLGFLLRQLAEKYNTTDDIISRIINYGTASSTQVKKIKQAKLLKQT